MTYFIYFRKFHPEDPLHPSQRGTSLKPVTEGRKVYGVSLNTHLHNGEEEDVHNLHITYVKRTFM
jgi:hypothetical protein